MAPHPWHPAYNASCSCQLHLTLLHCSALMRPIKICIGSRHMYMCTLIGINLSLFLSWVGINWSMRFCNWWLCASMDSMLLLNSRDHTLILVMLLDSKLLVQTKHSNSVLFWILISPVEKFLIIFIYWIPNLWHFFKQMIDFNIYSPNASSTSENIPCDSTSCPTKNRCSGTHDTCPYQVSYASSGTSSTGFLVEDMLHLITDDDDKKVTDAQITMGYAVSFQLQIRKAKSLQDLSLSVSPFFQVSVRFVSLWGH